MEKPKVESRSREEAESILWQPVKRGWERETQFPSYEGVEPLIPNPVAHTPTPQTTLYESPTLSPAQPFQPYHKPNERLSMPQKEQAFLEPIAEFEVHEEVKAEVGVAQSVRTVESATEHATVRLNARGYIAIAAFLATIVLVTVLIIINASSIGSSGAQIGQLRASNQELRTTANTAQSDRNAMYDRITGQITNSRTYVGNGQYRVTTDSGGGYFTEMETIRVPNSNNLQRPSNPDRSTNWFDRLSRWLSNLFR